MERRIFVWEICEWVVWSWLSALIASNWNDTWFHHHRSNVTHLILSHAMNKTNLFKCALGVKKIFGWLFFSGLLLLAWPFLYIFLNTRRDSKALIQYKKYYEKDGIGWHSVPSILPQTKPKPNEMKFPRENIENMQRQRPSEGGNGLAWGKYKSRL